MQMSNCVSPEASFARSRVTDWESVAAGCNVYKTNGSSAIDSPPSEPTASSRTGHAA